MCDFKLTEGILPDQSNAINVIRFLKPHGLVIRDLGYFSIDSLRMIESKLANYLSRLPFGVNIYLTSTDIRPLDVPKYLEKMMKRGQKSIAFDIYIGKEERYKTTLIAGTVPHSVVAKRINKYTKENGKKPSEGFKEWNGYTIFATNISLKMLTPIAIITLYKIRWQVELAFKDLKSNHQIDYIKGTSPERIESMIYGRLITIAAVFIISGHLSARLDEGKEISVYKLTKFLKIENRLKGAIKNNTLDELLILVEEHVEDVCKQVRSKKTTIQEILEVLTPPEIKEFDVAVNF